MPNAPQAQTPSNPTDAAPIARLYGQPLLKLPSSVYIPPDALEVYLEVFEGPLDLLLYLIREQNLNILDIPMAEITAQYMEYVEEIRNHNMDLAAEYLRMAAMLIQIKSKMLLPKAPSDGEGDADSGEDPRAELVRLLLEYEKIKIAAQILDQTPQMDRDFQRAQIHLEKNHALRHPDVNVAELIAAWREIAQRQKLTAYHRIERENISVREYMSYILKQLQGQRFVDFESIFQPEKGSTVLVVTLVALLELAKENLIEIIQAEAYAPIYLRLTFTPSAGAELEF